ncbi:MAG: SHOCT domain-containing protein [Acidimicrobiia bacterium]|nr:SHOCT domain-containing protein [Acidimicrobiia bacterium]
MLFAAEFGSGQVLWSIFWFFLFFLWIWLVISIFGDIIRSDDLSGGAKVLWSVVIIFLPYLGIFVYLIARGNQMGERQMQAAQAQDDAMRSYIRNAAGGTSSADQLATLAELHANGKIDDAEYASAKAKVISG